MRKNIKIYLLIIIVLFVSNNSISQIIIQPRDTIICNNSNIILFTHISASNNTSYQWQDSTNGNWNNLVSNSSYSGIDNDTLTINNIAFNGTKYFRCLIDTNANSIFDLITGTASLVILPPTQKAVISGVQSICYNTMPDTLKVTSTASGADGNFTYQWQQSLNGTNWNNISNANQLSYVPNSLTTTTYFRVATTSDFGCGTLYSDSVKVTVYAPLTSGVIGNSQFICNNTIPAQLNYTTTPTGGGILYTYQWKASLDSINFVDINLATSTTYQDISLNAHKYYKLQVNSTKGCGVLESNIVKVHVYNPVQAGSIYGNDTICYNTVPNGLTGINATGGNGLFSYQWIKSTNQNSWSNQSGATNINYNSLALTQSTYYKLVYTSQYGCGSDTSNSIYVHVWQPTQKSIINGIQSICYNSIPDTLKVTIPAYGADGNFAYQWQQSLNGTNWNNISNANQLNYVSNSLTTSTYFRVATTSDFGCGTLYSDSVKVTVYAPLTSGIIGNSQFICYNTVPAQLNYTSAPTGGGNLYTYQWKASLDSINFVDINLATSTTYQDISLNAHKYYKLQVNSTKGCGVLESNIVKVHVYNPVQAGSIYGNDTICYNTVPNGLTGINATGGNGLFSYQWIKSNNLATWLNQSGATNINFNPFALTQSTYYKLVYTSQYGCGSDTSNSIYVHVWQPTQKSIINGIQSICYNTMPDTLIVTTPASGADGNFNYQWQQSLNGTNWSNISNANQLDYVSNSLTSSTYFRVASTSTFGCGTLYSDSVKVTVYAPLTSGVIGSSQFICYNAIPNQLSYTTAPTGGGNLYTYQWKASLDSINFVDINLATSTTYQDISLNAHKFYKVQVTSTLGCGILESNVIKVHVYNPVVAGSISGNDTICYNTIPNGLTGINATGGNGLFNYQWIKSTNQNSWSNQSGTTNINYNPLALTQSTFYRLVYTSQYGCGSDTSNSIYVHVWQPTQKSIINGIQSICYNTIADTLKVTTPASGADGIFTYQWQQSLNGTNWNNISNANQLNYVSNSLTTSTYFRVATTSDFGCGTLYSDSVKVTVYAPLTSGVIGSSQFICYNTAPVQINYITNPTGGGILYSYKWRISIDSVNFTDISNASSNSYQEGNLTSHKFYKIQVTSLKGCGILESNIVKIHVYNPIVAGSIYGNDTVCWNYTPNIFTSVDATGGNGLFNYQWIKSIDLNNWNQINNANNTSYLSVPLKQTSYFKLVYTSQYGCGKDTSGFLKVLVNPLPDTINFIGNNIVCRNQTDVIYTIDNVHSNYSYNWFLTNGIILGGENTNQMVVKWNDLQGFDTIFLKQTVNETGCYHFLTYPVTISDNKSPDKANIIRKPNSNILVCSDSTQGIKYQWGFITKSTNQFTELLKDTLRYTQLPHQFDTVSYFYYVHTWFQYPNNMKCETKSYFNEIPLPIYIEEIDKDDILIYPNPVSNKFYLKSNNDIISNLFIYNIEGKLIEFYFNKTENSISLSNNTADGFYFLKVIKDKNVIIKKIIIKK